MLSMLADRENPIWTRLTPCRPWGTVSGCYRYPRLCPGLHSAVPTGLVRDLPLALTYFARMLATPADQENLIWTRLTPCRPWGTVSGCYRYPRLCPGLHSAVPTG